MVAFAGCWRFGGGGANVIRRQVCGCAGTDILRGAATKPTMSFLGIITSRTCHSLIRKTPSIILIARSLKSPLFLRRASICPTSSPVSSGRTPNKSASRRRQAAVLSSQLRQMRRGSYGKTAQYFALGILHLFGGGIRVVVITAKMQSGMHY